ncbi:MAG: type I methionyl aminopeptidase [Candidatus Jorgensenbacteria bacterium]|nr:type I methionyl aminopeptidase [Candidatus Jorgensenbacteria bacterium]
MKLKNKKDLSVLRVSGRILAETLTLLAKECKAGVSFEYLDGLARDYIKKKDAKPAFLGYRPSWSDEAYPAAICTSLNEQIVHGLPSEYRVREGDVVKLDLGVNYQGYFTDAATTVAVGRVPARTARLIRATRNALMAGIRAAKPGKRLGDVGYAIQRTVERAGFRVVGGLTGHGVGFAPHEEPEVLNWGEKGTGVVIKPGLVIAIEPMVSAGTPRTVQNPDGSFATADGSVAAHFEHTVYIGEDGPEILT